MLTTIRNEAGKIQASCEWWMVNELGQQDWVRGAWVWVEQIELSEGVESCSVIRQMIQQIGILAPYAVGSYWFRRDKTGLKPHEYSRAKLLAKEVKVYGQ